MPVTVAELTAVLNLDRANYTQGINEAQSAFVQLGQRASSASDDAAKSYQRLAAEAKKSGDAAKSAAQSANSAHASALDAAEKLRRKEVDLQRARSSGDIERVTRAEADLASARRRSQLASEREATASDRATDSINRAAAAAQRADRAYQQMGQSAARGMQQANAEVGRSNPFQALAASARDSGREAGESFAGAMPAPIGRAMAATGPVGMAIMAVAAVGLVAGKALAENIAKGLEVNAAKAFDSVKFGWTDAQAAEAGKAAAAAYGNAFGESVQANRQAAGLAIQSGLLDGNATAEQIQPVIEKLDTVTSILGTDIPETARAAGQMIRTGMAKDATEALDLLTVAQQNGLNVSGDLMDTLTEYGTQFRKLGIDGTTALGLIKQMWQAGARDTDVAADALKEFSDKAIDGSKSTRAAYEMLGLDVAETTKKLADGGKSASSELQVIWDKLSGVHDNVKRNEIGVALFGEKWVDLGGAINGMDISTAAQQLGEVSGAAQRASDGLSGAAHDIQAAKNKLSVAADEVRGRLAEAFAPSISEAAQWISDHIDEISKGLEILGGVAGIAAAAVGGMFGIALGGAAVVQQALSRVAEGFLKMARVALQAMSHIPGMGDLAKGNLALIDSQLKMVEGWKKGADATADFAAEVVKGSYSIAGASMELFTSEKRAVSATEAFKGLGIKVREVPDEKRIVIEDNSPEVQQKLKDLGIEVKTLPDGTVYIDAADEDAKAKIADLVKPEVKTIVVTTTQAKIGEELSAVNERRVAMGMKPLTAEEFGTGSIGAGVNGTGLSTTGDRYKVTVTGGPARATPTTPTQIQRTTAEKDDDAKAADKAAKAAEAARKKEEAAKAKAEKEQAAAAKKSSDAQAKIPGLESALAIAEQKVRELKPNASASSRMSAEQSVIKAREALEQARTDAKGATATTTGADGKPVTVTGDGSGGTVKVGTGSKPVQVEPANSAQGDGLRVFVTNMPAGGLSGGIKLSLFNSGGPVSGPGTGTSDSIPAMLSDGEFVVNAAQAARFGGLLQAINSGRIRAFRNGGAVTPNPGITGGTVQLGDVSAAGITSQEQQDAWDAIRQQFPSASLNSATRTQDVGSGFDFHMAGEAIDIGGSPALMMQIAEWIAANYPNSRELIHGPGFAKQIKNGKIVGDGGGSYGFYAGAGRHDDHVHWTPPSGFTFGGGAAVVTTDGEAIPLGAVGLTADSTPDDVAKAIIGEGRKRGYSDDDIRKILATAFGESALVMQNSKDGPWNGIFQQDASYKGRDDPNTNITGFFDELDKGSKDHTIEQRIVGVQQHHDADYLGVSAGDATYAENTITNRQAEADAIFDRVQASVPMSTLGTGSPTSPTVTTTDKPTGLGAGGVVDVRVTNWPNNLGSSGIKFSLFNTGGPVSGPGTSTSDSIPAMLSDGEYVVRAQAARANYGLLETINRAGKPLHLAGGGGVGIAPKIEAPKIAPTLGPGMALPIPGAATPTIGAGTTGIGVGPTGFDPLAALQGTKQAGVGGTQSPQEYAVQRLIQYGGDMAKIGVQALKEIALPSGLDSQQAQNVLGLIKGVGTGIQSSYERSQSQTSTSTDASGKVVTNNTTNNFYTQNVDEAFRKQTRNDSIKALSYDGSLV